MDPMLASVVGMFHEKLLVYHVIDKYLEYFPPGDVARRAAVLRNEERLLGAADCVFAVSQPLYERCLKANPNSFLVPNAVNYELFQAAMTNGKIPADVRPIPRPIVGYVGEIQTMFQFPLP
jgi:hypothetical protein